MGKATKNKLGRPPGMALTRRRQLVLLYLVDARRDGARVSLSRIQRACCIHDRADARRVVLALQELDFLVYSPPGKYLPTERAATWTGGGNDIRRRIELGAESEARRAIDIPQRQAA